ncbi:MAG: ABC transporter ATP-binding protein [Lachnospiraceae bacterium]|nr:ABC transporter ATP-binding protein [Lachnospiraceae bacterium]
MKLIARYCRPYALRMLYGLFIKIVGTFADLGLPWVLSYILDEVVPVGEIRPVLYWGAFMLFLAVAARYCNILANRKASLVARDVTRAIRHDLFVKTMNLSGRQTDTLHIPSLVSRMTSDTYNIHQMVGMMQRLGVRAPMILIGGIIITLTMEPVLTLVLVILLPILGSLIFYISRKGIPLYKKVQSSMDSMVRIMRENISGIRVIKALSKTEYEKKRFAEANDGMLHRELRAGSVMALSGPLMALLLNIGLTLVVVVGAYRVNAGASEPGKIVAFLSYFTMILNAVIMINRIFMVASKATASAGRIEEVLDAPEDLLLLEPSEEESRRNNAKAVLHERVPHIEFKHVSFGYHASEGETEKYCIRDISFRLYHGESLGIIGSTGCGKTTLLNLLMRFYDVTEGQILIDGTDIREIPLTTLRARFGVVFQNDVVFADTLKENISFGRALDDTAVAKAAKDALAAGFIEGKAEGYCHKAAIKGADLSGGQRQRLLVARALAGTPEVLLLDDASSALDYRTDAEIRKNIREHYADTTTILVAQRASSVMQMTNILVLEEGTCIGYGPHEELMEHCEIYHEIATQQMGDVE